MGAFCSDQFLYTTGNYVEDVYKRQPMFGLTIAFMDYKPAKGFFNSNWVGLKHFKNFFGNYYFGRLLRNTIRISFFSLLTFPVPIILALLLNELKSKRFSKWAQTITYLSLIHIWRGSSCLTRRLS